ncbi:hypothetical protein [Clostridium sp. CF012]|uniref:hypothetical protein n=1 Tax=Clostridium sp. CF012 TaxID=2843319 RepID=UPI001C0B3BA5|nr:hypothetical protein [Clostridium sp. CF012]MBU3145658.1 hypothetical protein [Clostridium sp. CF012]
MKKVVGEARPVLVELIMYIIIFVLKLLEFIFYKGIASGYPNIVYLIMDSDCIRASSFSLLIFIIIYFYLRNKTIDKNKVLIIVLIFTISLIYLVVDAYSYMYPTNLRISRSVGLLLSIITFVFIIYKGKITKH